MQRVFEFSNYRDYLRKRLSPKEQGKGGQSQLARHLGCQASYISLVLTGRNQLSLEYGFKVAEFLALDTEEQHYFLLLLQEEKAGSQDLKKYFQNQIEEIKKQKLTVRESVPDADVLESETQAIYYSSWIHSAVHIATAIPKLRSSSKIADLLGLSLSQVENSLDFLVRSGLVEQGQDGLAIGKKRIHLDTSSPFLPIHHRNWRHRAEIRHERPKADDLTFSGVVAISKNDQSDFRLELLKLIEKFEQILSESKEEELCVFLLDFFGLESNR